MLFFNEWRAAARAASAAERAVTQAYLLYCSGKGEMPSAAQIEDAKHKRGVANDLFSVALRKWRAGGNGGPLRE